MADGLDRRAFVAAPALAAALAGVQGSPALAQNSGGAGSTDETWKGAKAMLVRSGEFDWLKGFEEAELSDAVVYKALKDLALIEPPYDIYQLEHNIQTASATLDRCLVYRRDLQDLEAQAVQAALEYKLIEDQFASQLSLELAETIERQQALQQAGQTQAVTRFRSGGGDNLAQGFGALSEAGARVAAEAVDGEKKRKLAVKAKWEAFQSYQKAMMDRHRTAGHALNYRQRAERVRGMLVQDAVGAYRKCQAISKGARQVLGVDLPFPDVNPNGTLDALVLYVRELITAYELATQEEVEFEHVISLTQPPTTTTWPPGPALVPPDVWNQKLGPTGDRTFALDLRNAFPAAMKRLRVRAIGVSYLVVLPPNADAARRATGLSGVLIPPQAPNPFSAGSVKPRPPVPFGRIAMFEANAMRFIEDPAFSNLDPRGSWTLQIGRDYLPGFPAGVGATTGPMVVNDIRLHFIVAGQLDKAAAAWKTY